MYLSPYPLALGLDGGRGGGGRWRVQDGPRSFHNDPRKSKMASAMIQDAQPRLKVTPDMSPRGIKIVLIRS
eukprot:458173-Pyramimonas_sp.AAC.1